MPSIRIAVAALLALTACQRTEPEPTQPDPAPVQPSRNLAPIPGGDMKDAVAASNRFGLALYQQLRGTAGNQAFSPASISVALAMTYAGARGKTADEMRATLAFPESAPALHGGWASVLDHWQKMEDTQLEVANRLFPDRKYTLEPPFLDVTRTRYAAPVEALDFAGAPEKQRKHINDWVAEQTHKRIRDLIPENGVKEDTRMALVNAMYFKAKWMTPFNAEWTKEEPFAAPGGKVQVPMMTQVEHMKYAEVDGVQLAERSYENPKLAALFVLPKKGDSLATLEPKLDDALLERWTSALQHERVSMKLPRFEIDPKSSAELSKACKAMGMRLPFERTADFTGIANPTKPADRLYIDKIFHKAFVAMDEAGTEAAAATAVMMARAGGVPAEPKHFIADRPFLFFVRDVETGLVMFAGRVEDPSS